MDAYTFALGLVLTVVVTVFAWRGMSVTRDVLIARATADAQGAAAEAAVKTAEIQRDANVRSAEILASRHVKAAMRQLNALSQESRRRAPREPQEEGDEEQGDAPAETSPVERALIQVAGGLGVNLPAAIQGDPAEEQKALQMIQRVAMLAAQNGAGGGGTIEDLG